MFGSCSNHSRTVRTLHAICVTNRSSKLCEQTGSVLQFHGRICSDHVRIILEPSGRFMRFASQIVVVSSANRRVQFCNFMVGYVHVRIILEPSGRFMRFASQIVVVSSANRRVQFCNFMVGYVRIMFESFSNRPDASCDLRHKS